MLSGYGAQIRGVLPNTSEPYGGRRGSRGYTWALSPATEEGCGRSLLALASQWHQCLEAGKPCGLSFQGRPRWRRIPSERHWMAWTTIHGRTCWIVPLSMQSFGVICWYPRENQIVHSLWTHFSLSCRKIFKPLGSESTGWTILHSPLYHFFCFLGQIT